MGLSLRQMHYFVAIADAGAFARASEVLNIAQSALSLHVSEAEALLGIKLFERRPRGIVLTPAGERLYEHARAILALSARAELDLKTFNESASGPVSLGLAHTAEAVVSLPIIQAVGQRWPEVHLSIGEALSPILVDRVLSGALDLAVAFNPLNDARLEREPLLEEEIVLVGSADVIGKTEEPIEFSDIPQGMVLGLNPVPTSRSIIQAQILRNQIVPNPRLEIDSLSTMKKALHAGLGCALLARSTVGAELEAGTLNARTVIEPTLTRTLHLVNLADHPKTRAFSAVKEIVRQIIANEVARGHWPARPL